MKLKLIYPGRDTREAVKSLSDDWIVSGPIRIVTFLADVWHKIEPGAFQREVSINRGRPFYRLNGVNVFGPNEPNHPWVEWASASHQQYGWLYYYGVDMVEEYQRRYPQASKHGISAMLETLEGMPEAVPEGGWDEPLFATNVEFEL